MSDSSSESEVGNLADQGESPAAVDAAFSVPFVHRVRFTRDVLGADAEVLLDLLEASPGEAARGAVLGRRACGGGAARFDAANSCAVEKI